MGMPDTLSDQYFTYDDYLKWPDEERWEIIEGRPFAMTPSPTEAHQRISIILSQLLMNFFENKPCRVYAAPLDVRFPRLNEKSELVDTVVQPDLLVVCDPAKIDEKGVRGAPDLIIEILSETTAHRDLDEKLRLYEKHGVRCYIIADPWGKTLTVRYQDAPGHYADPDLFAGKSQMPVRLFDGLVLDLSRVFAGI